MADLSSAFADITVGAPASGRDLSTAFSDVSVPDVVPAAGGQPARITVRPPPPPGSAEALKDASLAEKVLAPITGLPETYTGMVRHGLEAAGQGAQQVGEALAGPMSTPETSALERAIQGIQEGKDIDYAVAQAQPEIPTRERSLGPIPISDRLKAVSNILGGFGKTVAGMGEYLTAPVFAPIRSIASQPIENVTGIPKEYTEFAAGLALPLPKTIPGLARAPEEFIQTRPTIPTEAQLRESGAARYQAPEVTGAPIQPPQAATQLKQQIQFDMTRGRVNPATSESVQRTINQLEAPGGLSLDAVEGLRQQLNEFQPIKDGTGKVTNKPELRAAAIARSRIDQFIRENYPEAAPTLEQARGDISAAESAATMSRAQFKAELRQARTGRPVSQSMQARMESILNNPSERRGFSQGELAMMRGIVEGGSPLERGGRMVERFAREEKAISPITRPVIAYPLSKLNNYLAARDVEKLNQAIRADSPLGRQLQTPLSDWTAAQEAFAAAPTARNRARLTIASRNLSNNLSDAGIKLAPDRLIAAPGAEDTGDEQ